MSKETQRAAQLDDNIAGLLQTVAQIENLISKVENAETEEKAAFYAQRLKVWLS